MAKCIYGNTVGAGGGLPKSFLLETEDGVQLVGVTVGEEVVFTADATKDIREGKIAATEKGVVVGSKFIPSYNTISGYKIIPAGKALELQIIDNGLDLYDYTALQCIICSFNTSLSNSVGSTNVVINDVLYAVNSTVKISLVTKDSTNKKIIFGVNNENNIPVIIRYFMCKELE